MSFAFLRTVSFRNLIDTETDLRSKDIFLVGENGQGKSNFLEALYFCSYASSFRGVRDRDIIRTGERDCLASLSFENSLHSKISVSYGEGKKTINVDGKRLDDRKELLSVAPSVVFCHEDMEFIAGSPERRRWFFDQTGSLWDPLYLEDLRRYRYVLKSRNAVLKSGRNKDDSTLDALDIQLARYGLELTKKRSKIAEEFSLVFEPLYREISGIAGIGIKYRPAWKKESPDEIVELLSEKREADFSLGVSLSGPHRDRYIFTREDIEFSGKASTGQRRLLALLLRIAQAITFTGKTGKPPVLLLDDVLLELDGEKRRKFISVMPEYEQAFYTFLPVEPYEMYKKPDTIVYKMEGGQVKRA
ncbi:MAG: DNA replication and repair protein RecF [Treponema sp.]|nr:DNA replication and repair protein RecF [Treponema sp.]